ncbi:conserved hypothetical protein [Segniliparus rotundus DSM 44985]|uniref:TPM domain-containing protein n=1 Tax=Segniliparus rotundus (strain ATCC BAA-972 / CDC 1076 / CIP 108378 / DSM 44985 / JCM 13578) TaxID=640132 RepID=D6Z7K7_SEGRD|nr:DUF6676 family protein [Segniliparus rotundus]ADG97937.1 conserved hypothetical protein [Segniliparus rotundus DSM 44985]
MSPRPLKQDLPPGSDPAAIRADLVATGVHASPSDRPGLTEAVARAKGQGLSFEVLVLPPGPYVPTQLRNLATEVAGSDPVTVLALAPGFVGSYSASVTRVRLENAQDELDANPTVAANQFLDRLFAPSVSWTGVSAALSVLVLVAVLVAKLSRWGGRWKTRSGRANEDWAAAKDGQ